MELRECDGVWYLDENEQAALRTKSESWTVVHTDFLAEHAESRQQYDIELWHKVCKADPGAKVWNNPELLTLSFHKPFLEGIIEQAKSYLQNQPDPVD